MKIKLRNERYDLDYDVTYEEFFKEKEVQKMFLEFFAEEYNISLESAKRIIEDCNIDEDEAMLEYFAEKKNDELDEIFFNYDWVDPLNRYR